MSYDPKAIANYFLEKARSQSEDLTPMKVQKLVYFANGWYLAIKDEPLINEQVEAWKFGPVIPSLYRAFRRFGDEPIVGLAIRRVSDFSALGEDAYRKLAPRVDDAPASAEFVKAFLDRVWETYGIYTAIQLSNETHKTGSPWDRVFRSYGGAIPRRTDIPAAWMKEYFSSLSHRQTQAQ